MTTSANAPKRIVLTGFMGSGKSTVGPRLARALGWHFLDADQVIESESGCSISEIFLRHGEPFFRQIEAGTIVRLCTEDRLVLALGGGAFEREETRTFLLQQPGTRVVHLDVQLQTTLTRCRGTEATRPVLADASHLAERYERRMPLYREAHLNVAVDHLRPNQVVDAILTATELTSVKSSI